MKIFENFRKFSKKNENFHFFEGGSKWHPRRSIFHLEGAVLDGRLGVHLATRGVVWDPELWAPPPEGGGGARNVGPTLSVDAARGCSAGRPCSHRAAPHLRYAPVSAPSSCFASRVKSEILPPPHYVLRTSELRSSFLNPTDLSQNPSTPVQAFAGNVLLRKTKPTRVRLSTSTRSQGSFQLPWAKKTLSGPF